MKKRPGSMLLPFVASLLALAGSAAAQPRVTYEVSFPNAEHHEAIIEATFQDLPPDEPLVLQMSRASPGRYALHEFARNVYGLEARNGRNWPLAIVKPDPYHWVVENHDGEVRVKYILFGARADGTYNYIGTRFVQLNMPATFLWSSAITQSDVKVRFGKPQDDWSIATQLFPTEDSTTFTAPDLSYLMDSPVHIGPIEWREWTVEREGESYEIRLAVDHAGTSEEVDEYARLAEQVVDHQIDLWRDIPDFEPGSYTFLATYLPQVNGDGMEHRNSTILTSPRALDAGESRNLRTLSHEFFHAWNVERLRPASLEPFDLMRANMSPELWFAEGITSYYDSLFLRRAGIIDDEEWAEDLSGTIDAVVNTPARDFETLMGASRRAPFVDAAAAIDPDNHRNTFLSYYTWGAGIGIGLDLTLRARFDLTLDDFMRAMWTKYGRNENPYSNEDLREVLAELTTPEFADETFDRFIDGREVFDYESLLKAAGFQLRKKESGRSWLGAALSDREGRVVVDQRTLIGSPFYQAGIEEGDVILEVDAHEVTGAAYMKAIADLLSPGRSIEIKIDRHGESLTKTVILTENPELEVVTYESTGLELSESQRAFRRSWLGEAEVSDPPRKPM